MFSRVTQSTAADRSVATVLGVRGVWARLLSLALLVLPMGQVFAVEFAVKEYKVMPVCDANWQIKAAADFNGDGHTDILYRHRQSGELAIWLMERLQVRSVVAVPSNTDLAWDVAGLGDFNADGRPDILWNHAAGHVVVWYMNGPNPIGYDFVCGEELADWKVVGVEDLNGDGSADLVWRHKYGTDYAIWDMRGAQYLGYRPFSPAIGSDYAMAAIVNYDLDDDIDIIWHNTGNGYCQFAEMNFASWTSQQPNQQFNAFFTFGYQWELACVGDFDRDGQVDLLWRHGYTGENHLWAMRTTQVPQPQTGTVEEELPLLEFYKTPEAAAKAAIYGSWRNALDQELEYGGVIYKLADNIYGFTMIVGERASVRLPMPPRGGRIVGHWHIHWPEWGHDFSFPDIQTALDAGVDSWLGTCTSDDGDGKIRLFKVREREFKTVAYFERDAKSTWRSSDIFHMAYSHTTGDLFGVQLNQEARGYCSVVIGVVKGTVTFGPNVPTRVGLGAGPLSIDNGGTISVRAGVQAGVPAVSAAGTVNVPALVRSVSTQGPSGALNPSNYGLNVRGGGGLGVEVSGVGLGAQCGVQVNPGLW